VLPCFCHEIVKAGIAVIILNSSLYLAPFIEEVCSLFYAVQDIGNIIKEGGINPTAYGMVVQKLTKLTQQYPNNTRVPTFTQKSGRLFQINARHILSIY
jgi:hypothetical protein